MTFPSRRWRRRIPYCYPLKQLWDCSVQGPCSLGEAVWPGPARSQGCGHYVPPGGPQCLRVHATCSRLTLGVHRCPGLSAESLQHPHSSSASSPDRGEHSVL